MRNLSTKEIHKINKMKPGDIVNIQGVDIVCCRRAKSGYYCPKCVFIDVKGCVATDNPDINIRCLRCPEVYYKSVSDILGSD